DCSLFIYLPYRDLKYMMKGASIDAHLKETWWSVINDAIMTDSVLLHSPFHIAL
ncbi:MAG: hypothetical protein MHPSP_002995, partial [Paramarteilia canceri]